MTDQQLVRCPHCGKTMIIDVSNRLYWLSDVHPERKSFDDLHEMEIEHEYVCDKCAHVYYVTLLQKVRTDRHMLIDFERFTHFRKAKEG